MGLWLMIVNRFTAWFGGFDNHRTEYQVFARFLYLYPDSGGAQTGFTSEIDKMISRDKMKVQAKWC